jgi:DegV family protein with EDD domain
MAIKSPIRILTDTTAAVSRPYLREKRVELLHQVIIFGEQTFLEEAELSFPEFLDKLRSSRDLPKTAAPPVSEAETILERMLEDADTVICIHPSTELSGTVRTVETARSSRFPDADIRILDTRVVGAALGSMVSAATEWAEHGMAADEIMHNLEALIPRARTYFLVDTLEYLRRGGRIGGAASLVGSALKVKPILHLEDGRIDALEKVRTQTKAMERLVELTLESCPADESARLALMHADAAPAVEQLRARLFEHYGFESIPVLELGAAITVHGGPGIVGVSFLAQA